jgi:glycosyltransferase involved in cell wall biosynthesis
MTTPDVSVVVCTYNRADLLREALGSLVSLETGGDFSYEVVVVDNASTDHTGRVVEELARTSRAPVRRVCEPRAGIAFSRNRGVDEARGRWIAFFDDDQLADPHWLTELMATARRCGARCVGGSRTLRLPEDCRRRLAPFCRELLGEYVADGAPRVYGRKTTPTTGNLLVEAGIFREIARFDESLHASGEDAHLFYFIRRARIEGWYNPRAVVHHVIPSYRLSDAYLRWTAQRHGFNSARLDGQLGGRPRLAAMAFARLGQAVCIHFPELLTAKLVGDHEAALGIRCRLWRTVGYLRGSLQQAAPRLGAQRAFLNYLKFRSERNAFTDRQPDP